MRILMLVMRYPTGAGQSFLTTELADALISEGHQVEVLHLDWDGKPRARPEEFSTRSGVRVVRMGASSVSGFGRLIHHASKFLLSSEQTARVARSEFDLGKFDIPITWMPASAFGSLVQLLEHVGIAHRILFIWDFFPDHHHEIGRIPDGLPLRLARSLEQRLIKHFTAIICTLPGNAEYLRRRFHVMPSQRVLVTPVWGETAQIGDVDRAGVRSRYALPQDASIAVFGGQLVEGRGFDQMLAAANAALIADSRLHFLFVGAGRLELMIRDRAANQANVHHRPFMSRAEYLQLLGCCDVGMVATVPGVSSFSIPSKTIDYLRAGLPIVAAVEHGNDYLQILDTYDIGAGVPFGDGQLFFAEAQRLAARGPVTRAATQCLQEVFDVRHAVATLMDAIRKTPEERAA